MLYIADSNYMPFVVNVMYNSQQLIFVILYRRVGLLSACVC